MLPEKKFNQDRVSGLFDVLAYDDKSGLFWCDDGALGYGFHCRPLLGADQNLQNQVNSLFALELPHNTAIQIVLYSSGNLNDVLSEYRYLRDGQQDSLLRGAVNSRIKFLKRLSHEPQPGQAPARAIKLVITAKVPVTGAEPSPVDIEKVGDLRILFQKSLDSIGLMPSPMDASSYLQCMREILMKGDEASWADGRNVEAEEDKPLSEQIVDWDKALTASHKGVGIGDTKIRTLSVKQFPKSTYPGYGLNYLGDVMSGARGIRSHFVVSATLFFPDATKLRANMDLKRQVTVGQATGPLVKFAPIIALKRESFEVLNAALDDGDRLAQIYFSVSVFGKTFEQADEAASAVRSYLSEYNFQLIPDKFYVLPLLLNSLPFGADVKAVRGLFRYKTMATRQFTTLLPMFGDWVGTGTPVQTLISRNGQLQSLDMYDSSTNFNSVVAAQSGSGKSFFVASMIFSYATMNASVWVIDIGRSYLKLCQILGGDFIHFGEDSDVCLNPFELVGNYDKESDLLVGLVVAMAAPTQPLTDHQTANLRRIMGDVWKQLGKKMSVDSIAEACLSSDDRRIQDVGEQLYPFTTRGEYGRYFNGRNNVDFKNRLTVLELDDLQGREHLQQVVLLQLIYQIQQACYFGDKNQRKVTIIDESWALLSKGTVGLFVENGFRRFRKVNASATVISQGIDDFHATKSGQAIVENSSNMYLLKQKGDAIDRLKSQNKLPLNEFEMSILKTVSTVPGYYSELYCVTERGRGVGRLIVDPYQYLLFSTKAQDVAAVEAYAREGMEMNDAICAVLRDRGIDA